MNEFNIYGKGEVKLVLIHGGPGATGSLKDLAILLSKDCSVLEINQSKFTIKELVDDMNTIISNTCNNKVILLGHSWGAWLICLYANNFPEKIDKLILVGSGPFEDEYVKENNERRLSRLDDNTKQEYDILLKSFMSNDASNKDQVMSEFGSLMARLDTFEYEGNDFSSIGNTSYQMFNSIWPEASELRSTGELLTIMKGIDIPIHIIQGEYDSHEIKGIINPFNKNKINHTYNIIPNCGHYPWREKHGKKEFLKIIVNAID